MKVILANTDTGTMIVEKDNKLHIAYVYQLHNGASIEDCVEYLFELDEDDDLIKIDISNGFKVIHWHDLYQYNCCSSNETYLKELCQYFKRDDLLKELNNPLDNENELIQNFKHYEYEKEEYSHCLRSFSFDIKNMKVKGEISFIKYIFLDHNYYGELNLDELVSFHISLNKKLAQLVLDCNKTDYSSLEYWAENNAKQVLG